MQHRVAAGLMAAVLMISCSPASPTTPTPPSSPAGTAAVRFTGTLIDYQSGKTIAGAKIDWTALTEGNTATFMSTTSDAAGRFDVTLPAGSRYLYSLPSGNINLGSGLVRAPWKHSETPFLVNGGPCAARYGYVSDAITHQPIAGATVLRDYAATTNADGYYRIDLGCEQLGYERWGIGTTTISANGPGYAGAFEFDGRREGTGFSGVRRVDFALQPVAP